MPTTLRLATLLALGLYAVPAAAQPYGYALVLDNLRTPDGLYSLSIPNRLVTFDAATGTAIASFSPPAAACGSAFDFAPAPDGSRIYFACAASRTGPAGVIAVDATTRTVVASNPIAAASVAVTPDGSKVVVLSAGTVVVLSPSSLAVLDSAASNVVAPSMIVTNTHAFALQGLEGKFPLPGAVATVDLASMTVGRISLPHFGLLIAAAGDGARAAVFGVGGRLWVVDAATQAVTTSISSIGGGSAFRFDANRDGTRAYLATQPASAEYEFIVVDLVSQTVVVRRPIGTFGFSAPGVALLSSDRALLAGRGFGAPSSLTTIDTASGAQLNSTAVAGNVWQIAAVPATVVPSPDSCTYGVQRLVRTTMPSLEPGIQDVAGGTFRLGVTALPDRCTWSAQSDVPWMSLNAASGTASAILTLTIAPNPTGVVRTGRITVSGQTFSVTQAACADPLVVFDSPHDNSVVRQPVHLQGWAIDRCSLGGTGLLAAPSATLGTSALNYGAPRPDVAAIFGQQFLNSGFNSGPLPEQPPGTRNLSISFFVESRGFLNPAVATARNVTFLPSSPPFGVLETPSSGAIVVGEMPLTGWALDDVRVTDLRVYRHAVAGEVGDATGRVFVGQAPRVAGARPDVRAAFPAFPENDLAGFGLMVLTNVLPNNGNGVFVFSADAVDAVGHVTTLGERVITATNGSSTLPFGTIDTPRQGATVSGIVTNFGWALAQQPNAIPIDGSTIDVVIDGVVVGHPIYNQPRSDISTLFPGYANSGGPVGYYVFDSRTLSNGVHTIAWVIRDNAGNAKGVGSRYFTVANP